MAEIDWNRVSLGEHIELQMGFPFKSAEYTSDATGIALVRGDNVVQGRFRWEDVKRWPMRKAQDVQSYLLAAGDIVLAMDRPWIEAGLKFAQVHETELPCLLVQRVARMRAKKTVDQNFLRYIIGSRDFTNYILAVQTGTAVPHISGDQIRSYTFKCPSLEEQKSIGAILRSLDDKIELNRRMNQTLEQIAQALFQSWFIDFDPVRAKQEGRQPEGMDAETAALFPNEFEESELGTIPKGWKVRELCDVADINVSSLSKSDPLATIQYIEISEVNRGVIGNMPTYIRGEEPSRARRKLQHGDTVLSTVRPDRGAYFLALEPPKNRIASTGFAVISPAQVPWSFAHAFLTRKEVSDYLGHVADGGAYPAVSPDTIGKISCVVPDKAILTKFHTIAGALYELADQNRNNSRHLANVRDTLLPRLLSGEAHVTM